MVRVTILAATGRLGPLLAERLLAVGHQVVAVGRDPAKLAALPTGAEARVADLDDAPALQRALADAQVVVSCANAVFAPAILAALPPSGVERIVLMGSTRVFSRVPDATAAHVQRARELLEALPIPSVLLLASLIYGAGGSVADGLAARLRRSSLMPLPAGGRMLVQPIHVDDVASALAVAATREEVLGQPIVIAGPDPITYGDMVRRIAAAIGRSVTILPVPGLLFTLAGRILGLVPALAGLGGTLRRLVEDKDYDIGDMRRRLGIEPRPFRFEPPPG